MRSYFCEKCNYEFDLEEPEDADEAEETAFCPKCLTTLARVLPETPERIIARAHRIELARQKQVQRAILLVFLTLIVTGTAISGMICFSSSFWGILFITILSGMLCGFWTRKLTQDRSWRAGLLAVILLAVFTALCMLLAYFSGRFYFAPACRNLVIGVIPAWCIAVFER